MTDPQTTTSEGEVPTRAAWPTVIGVLCLLYGLFGFVSNSCGLFWQQGQKVFFSMTGIPDVEIPSDIATMTMISGLLGMCLVILLVVGSVLLLRRRPSAMKFLKIWVVLQLILTIAAVVAGFLMIDSNIEYSERVTDAVREMLSERGDNADAVPRQSEEEMRRSAYMGLIFGVPMQLAFPVVIGLLLTRRKWREQAAGWEEAA